MLRAAGGTVYVRAVSGGSFGIYLWIYLSKAFSPCFHEFVILAACGLVGEPGLAFLGASFAALQYARSEPPSECRNYPF